MGDFIGAILFPFGTYFPGFTVSAAISGFIYGTFLYQNPEKEVIQDWKFLIKLMISSMLVLGIVNIFITSVWLHILYQKAYFAVLTTRVVAQIIMFPIQVIVIYFLEKFTRLFFQKYLLGD